MTKNNDLLFQQMKSFKSLVKGHNLGFMTVGKDNGKIQNIRVSIGSNNIIFSHNKSIYSAKMDGESFYCSVISKRIKANNKTFICSDFRDVIGQIVNLPKNQLDIKYGQLHLRDITFLFYIIPNGFLIKLDLGYVAETYGVIHQEGEIIAVHQHGEWDFDDPKKTKMIGEFSNYSDALNMIYDKAKEVVTDLLKLPNLIN